ncbi:hypothetical protein [Pseudobacteroides cellulosolvens]|uniref:Uncharacterized protein n=1 Tax=Pseudobacteroides cellulosolvens ATCC 35603 = DSM 2933 TaxID=398512 RepID=A0A0L6JWN5_9FIRM|nr:hypothetical protein [Pseudobacteroides cellulosolvens]KNY29842.1 hypothetical protein Bccel_5119 [Pseudobacteroides cellulosolvens ATCC 35603 = DSM 2933]
MLVLSQKTGELIECKRLTAIRLVWVPEAQRYVDKIPLSQPIRCYTKFNSNEIVCPQKLWFGIEADGMLVAEYYDEAEVKEVLRQASKKASDGELVDFSMILSET